MSEYAIKVNHLSKEFKLPHERHSSLKSVFLNLFRSRRTYERQEALNDISFEVKQGDFLGIVGRNGSGKSTLLKLLAGIYDPSSGDIHVRGKLTPFIELGVGFNPELTGRENVFLNGALLGFNRKEMSKKYNEIVKFAELEKFMDQKLKNYSSGMQVRLAFSIAIRANSEILLLDEVLAVGDALFQQKCFDYFHELRKSGRTVLLVSHDISVLRQYCTKGILIESGEIVYVGKINEVADKYIEIVSKKESAASSEVVDNKQTQKRRGTGRASVVRVSTCDSRENKKTVFTDMENTIKVNATYQANENIQTPVLGITIKNTAGQSVFSSNNIWQGAKSKDLVPGEKINASWVIPNIFNTGQYYISPAIADADASEMYDWADDMASFKIRKKSNSSALVNPDHNMSISD